MLFSSSIFAVLIFAPAQPSVAVHQPTVANDVEPSVALTDQGLVVAWVKVEASKAEVLYSHSPDFSVFSAPVSVSGAAGESETIRPCVAAFGSRAVIVWSDASRGDHDVYAAISDDGGRIFAPPVLVAGGEGGQLDPRAAVLEDGTIAIVFSDTFGSTSADRGLVRRVRLTTGQNVFSQARAVADIDPQQAFDLSPAITGTSTITIAWLRAYHDGRTAILKVTGDGPVGTVTSPLTQIIRGPRLTEKVTVFEAIDDGYGDIRSEILRLNSTIAFHQSRPDIAGAGQRTIVTWLDHSELGRRKIVYREVFDEGNNLSEEKIASDENSTAEVNHPAIAVGPDIAVIVFEDARGGSWDVRATVLR